MKKKKKKKPARMKQTGSNKKLACPQCLLLVIPERSGSGRKRCSECGFRGYGFRQEDGG